MKDLNLLLFTFFCTICAETEYLNLTDQQLIRLYEECLVMAEYIEDCSTLMINVLLDLGELFNKTEQFTEAVTCFERVLVMAVESNIAYCQAIAFGRLGIIHNSLGNSNGMKQVEEMAYGYLGMIYHTKGEYQTAINYHKKAIAMSQELNDKSSEGYAYYHLGNTYWSLDMHEEAKKCYKKCLSVISLINNKQMEQNVYEYLSEIYQSSGKHAKAITYSEKLMHLVKEDNDGEREAQIYGRLGDAYKSLGKVDKAIDYYTKQLVLAEKIDCKKQMRKGHFNLGKAYHLIANNVEAIKHAETLLTISIKTGDIQAQSTAYECLGLLSQYVSDFYKTIEYCRKFLNILALETNSCKKNKELSSYVKMGEAYCSLGKYDEAICCHEKALSIAEEIEDVSSKGMIYGKMGVVFESLDEYDKSLNYGLEALRIAKETGNKIHELDSDNLLGRIYSRFGKFHESLQCYEKVLDLQRETGSTAYIPNTLANVQGVYKSVGKCDNALKNYEVLLRTSQNIGNRQGVGEAYMNMTTAYEDQGKYQEAMDCSKKSLAIAQEIGDKNLEGRALVRLGSAYSKQKRYNEAMDCFKRSLVIAKEIGSKKIELLVCFQLADLFFHLGIFENARDYSEKALILAKSLRIKKVELSARRKLGLLYYIIATIFRERPHVSDEVVCTLLEQCKKHLEQSLQCCEWIFDHLHDRDDCKVTIVDTYISTYKRLTSVLIETEEINEALLVSDRGKARALNDLLQSRYKEVPQGGKNVILSYTEVDSILCKSEFSVLYFSVLLDVVAIWVLAHQKPPFFREVNTQGFRHGSGQLPTSQGINDGSEIISEVVSAAYDAMNVRSTVSCEDRSLDHLSEDLELRKSDADCFVKGDGQKEREIRAPDQDKQKSQEEASNGKNDESNANPLEMLYTNLIAPVMPNLTHEEVVIVPDGPLYMVPFAALRDPQTGLFLSQMKRIRLVPSLATLKSLQESPADYHSKTGALVVGDPDSGTVMFQGEERTFWPLPKARLEAKVIGNILDVEPLIGAQATKDVIMQRLHEGVAVIHIAAHGSTEGEIVLAPSTLTGGRKIPEEEDYMLTMNEVQKTGIKAQLVVLSCCHSGRGEIRAEGIVGISRGFLAAGARAVVASLWAIDDEATLSFMFTFYDFLKKGESASRSLQEAMNDVREDFEPKHWAPFFLIGDDVTITM